MKIVFHVGGPRFHPVDEQALRVQQWLGKHLGYEMHDGVDAFDHLGGCDLLVLMGLHWTGMNVDWAGNLVYRPVQERHKQALEDYAKSSRPR